MHLIPAWGYQLLRQPKLCPRNGGVRTRIDEQEVQDPLGGQLHLLLLGQLLG